MATLANTNPLYTGTSRIELDVNKLPSVDSVIKRVNERFDALFHVDEDGVKHALVCCICDEFLILPDDFKIVTPKKMKSMKDTLSWSNVLDERRTLEHEKYFRPPTNVIAEFPWTKGMALSPRTVVYQKKSRGAQRGFSCCKRCHGCTKAKKPKLPRHAIVNKNYVGVVPSVLEVLTDVELAFITPVKCCGYCFTYNGGKQMNLKGTLSFMRVEPEKIARAAGTLEKMGLNDHILVLFTGKMTKAQRQRAKERCTIRTQRIIDAVKWLCENNDRWKGVDYREVTKDLEDKVPVIYDRTKEVESADSNVESQELFTCYYPDGCTSTGNGGLKTTKDFKSFVNEMAEKGFKPELEAKLNAQFLKQTDADILLDSCLLQFPYGLGGKDELRILQDGSMDDRSNLEEFCQHLSRISQPGFQKPLFQLVLYSLISKARIFKSSHLTLRGKTDAANLASGLSTKDVTSCITGRKLGNRYAGTAAARTLLNSVNATARALPHTDDFAAKNRGYGEAMQHHFGMPSVFLTFTFDDENSLLMQVMEDNRIDDSTPVNTMSDKELSDRCKKRRELRISQPGIAAMNFEILMHIMMEEVVGWDMANSCPSGKPGFFGKVFALLLAIEEQGRNTLHGHMTMWVHGHRAVQERYFFGKKKTIRDEAKSVLRDYHEHCCSTELFPEGKTEAVVAFDHDCVEPNKRNRMSPEVIGDQLLRTFRNRHGYKDHDGVFAFCPHLGCKKIWTYEDMVGDFMASKGYCEPVSATNPQEPTNKNAGVSSPIPEPRMRAAVIEYQKGTVATVPREAINATYQHHKSCHVTNCFRCQKKGQKKRGHVCGPDCECRYRLPDIRRRKVEVYVQDDSIWWYSWDGTRYAQPLATLQPMRRKYDLFQNVSCNAVSHSKLSCNSNCSIIVEGPVGGYTIKYCFKENNAEESADYKHVQETISSIEKGDRVHENDRSEALRKLCRAGFAHDKSNVVSAPFASHLIRNTSRFYFSHEFGFCPLKDLVRLHNKQEVQATLQYTPDGTQQYFENLALNYLCRNEELEAYSAKDLHELYQTCRVPSGDYDDTKIFPHVPKTSTYEHPSVLKRGKRKGKCDCGFKIRDSPVLAKVCQWIFPDTATFKANIFTCEEEQFRREMEIYAQHVLTLLMPHRCAADLKIPHANGFPYLRRLRFQYHKERLMSDESQKVVFTNSNMVFLQNIQNSRSNTLRYRIKGDALTDKTDPYVRPDDKKDPNEIAEQEEEEPEPDDTYEMFSEMISQQYASSQAVTDDDPTFLNASLHNFEFTYMRAKGRNRCGAASDLQVVSEKDGDDFIADTTNNNDVPNGQAFNDDFYDEKKTHTIDEIVKLHLRKNEMKFQRKLWDDKNIEVEAAVGTVKSIRQWADLAFSGDKKQKRAFEVLTASFLLTFYDDKPEDEFDPASPTHFRRNRSKYRRMYRALKRLRGTKIEYNLICLLHGPGGSGKSTVINAVIAYAADYCLQIGHEFNSRTICVTAMSGVAATLLHGETTHSVLGLNRTKLPGELIDQFADARLIIIDECSFAAEKDIIKMDKNLRILMQNTFQKFGGINIVFAGDYSQLEPVKKAAIYKDGNEAPVFHGALNCYIELEGKWRFKDDVPWGERMLRMRDGETTIDDIEAINERHVSNFDPPEGIQVASHTNKDRDAINAAIFDDYTATHGEKGNGASVLKSACMIFMDDLYMNDSSKTKVPVQSNQVKRWFYEHCTEDSCKTPSESKRSRVDPCLKLYSGCPLMLTENNDVINGQANGSRVFLKKIRMKVGEEPFYLKLDNGTTIRAMYASQVKCLTVEHECDDITPREFDVEAESINFTCKLMIGEETLYCAMKGTQFPVISNSCTTGHKLQGCTVENILANDWFYGANWAYVVLSRVKTMGGLYMRQKLSTDLTKYKKPQAMLDMIKKFRDTIAVEQLDESVYEAMIRDEEFAIADHNRATMGEPAIVSP